MKDQEIYNQIGKLLIDTCSSDAQKVIVRAKLFSEGNGGTYEFDYINQSGALCWFDPPPRKVVELTELLVSLRKEFIRNDLVGENRAWEECEINLDVNVSKIGIKFSYDD